MKPDKIANMDSDKEDEVFTAQGRDTPGPVESCGVGAGHARPSTSDCPEPAVGDQAGVLRKVTGSGSGKADGGEIPIFAKRSFKTARTPPKTGLVRMGSFSKVERKIGYGRGLPSTENVNKRQRELETSPTQLPREKSAKREDTTIRQLIEKIGELKEEIDDSIIKTANMVDLIDKIETLAKRVETESAIRQMGNAGDGSLGKLREIRGQIVLSKGYKDIQNLIIEKWPRDAYKVTTWKDGDPLTGEEDLVWFRPPPPDTQTGRRVRELERKVTRRYPEVEEMTEPGWETLTVSTTRTSKAGRAESRLVHVGNFGEYSGEAIYCQLGSLRDHLRRINRTAVAIPVPPDGGAERVEWAKITECVMNDTGIRVVLYGRKEGDESRKKFRSEALFVTKPENIEYVDMVRRIKEKVQVRGSDIMVKRIRKTRTGDVLLELNDDDNGKILKEMVEKVEGAKVRKLEKGDPDIRKYIIRDIDVACNQEEVMEALIAAAGDESETHGVTVVNLRQAYDGTLTAIVEVSRRLAERIWEKGGFKIGLTKCRLREWVEVIKCHKCWELGHTQASCKNEDRRSACLRCGKEGHKVETCDQPLHCPLCNRDGHRAGSGACPKMRVMLRKLREKARPKLGQPRSDINL